MPTSDVKYKQFLFFLVTCPLLFALSSRELHSEVSDARVRFEDRADSAGIEFILDNSATPEKHMIEGVLGGIALLDYDNDSYLDVFFTNGADIPSLQKKASRFFNRLYRNLQGVTFEDVTLKAGVEGVGYSMGAAAADWNNDGWTDLFVAGVNANLLYLNNGDGTFADVTEKAGVSGKRADGTKPWSVAAAWLDYDNDGDLDLFVVNYLQWSFEEAKLCGRPDLRLTCSPALYEGLPNILYRNEGDGTFRDASDETGIARQVGKGMSIAVADYDADGFVDVFVTNDNERNFLYHNLKGERFEELGIETGVAFPQDGIPISNMGVDFRDFTGDGRPDLAVTALAGETFPLFFNEGNGFFSDLTFAAQVGMDVLTKSGWGVGSYDFDNDGHKDFFFAGSHVSENVEEYVSHHRYELPNLVFLSRGDGTFRNVSEEAGDALQRRAAHRGAAFGDLNNDGGIDVVVSVIGKEAELLYNAAAPGRNWLLLELKGRKNTRMGLGARVRLETLSGRVQYNHVTTALSYASSCDHRVHFGTGEEFEVRSIEIIWPNGHTQTIKNVRTNQILRVEEE